MPISMKLDLFTQHSRLWQGNRFVYPVISRRSKGLSIGVNLNPDKACNFDCVYCSVDRTVPPAVRKVDLRHLGDELDRMLGLGMSGELFRHSPFDRTPPEYQRVNDVAFSGDGEPTTFKGFPEACTLAADLLRRHHAADVKIVVITNATLLHRPAVAAAMEFLDQNNGEIWAKLDAGTFAYYREVDRTSIPLSRVLKNIAAAGRVRPIVIQSLFMKLRGEEPPKEEIAAYVQRLRELTAEGCRIKLVQVYTVARGTAEASAAPLSDASLDGIVEQVRATGLAAEAFYGPR